MKATNYGSIIVEGKQPKSWKTSSIMNDNNNRILKWLDEFVPRSQDISASG